MSTWKVSLADVVISEDEIATVAEVYRSGRLSMSPDAVVDTVATAVAKAG